MIEECYLSVNDFGSYSWLSLYLRFEILILPACTNLCYWFYHIGEGPYMLLYCQTCLFTNNIIMVSCINTMYDYVDVLKYFLYTGICIFVCRI